VLHSDPERSDRSSPSSRNGDARRTDMETFENLGVAGLIAAVFGLWYTTILIAL
jgi:hypothetical protein